MIDFIYLLCLFIHIICFVRDFEYGMGVRWWVNLFFAKCLRMSKKNRTFAANLYRV